LQFLVNIIVAAFQFASPFLIKRMVTYILAGKDLPGGVETWETMKPGIILASLLVSTQLTSYLINEHLINWQVVIGARASNCLSSFIYNKNLKISPATSKEFSNGEIVNFMQVDALQLYWLC